MIRLPPVVRLPAEPIAPAGGVYRRCGVTRQAVAGWRRNHAFPHADARRMIRVDAVAAWLAARGSRIEWI